MAKYDFDEEEDEEEDDDDEEEDDEDEDEDDDDDEEDDDEDDDEDEDDEPADTAPKKLRKASWESAMLGLSFIAIAGATLVMSFVTYDKYNISFGIWPPKVEAEQLAQSAQIVAQMDINLGKYIENSSASVEGSSGLSNSNALNDALMIRGVLIDKGANHGVIPGQVWSLRNDAKIQIIITEVQEDKSIGYMRPQTFGSVSRGEIVSAEFPSIAADKDNLVVIKADANQQFLLKVFDSVKLQQGQ
ncbi:MAG: hypothetical protein NUW37_14875 [Planctomycetes bacterium]|nr:hypothetical protein [Planctomycetota bacterium]